jgi:iron complex transport system ATP-binding protein
MIFQADNLHYAYAGGAEFQHISLSLAARSLSVLLGPNGSGKSTLLKALAGILPLRGGKLRFAGLTLPCLERRALARLLAYLPQSLPAASLTVYDTLLLGRTPHIGLNPGRRDHAAVHEVMERLGLEAWKQRPLDELSGGERRKVFIGMALAQGTPILLLDEPARSLDPRHQLEIYGLLYSLCREENKIILTAEHDLNLAAGFADQLLMLHGGVLAARGDAESVLTPELLREVYGIEALVLDRPCPDGLRGRSRPHVISLDVNNAAVSPRGV